MIGGALSPRLSLVKCRTVIQYVVIRSRATEWSTWAGLYVISWLYFLSNVDVISTASWNRLNSRQLIHVCFGGRVNVLLVEVTTFNSSYMLIIFLQNDSKMVMHWKLIETAVQRVCVFKLENILQLHWVLVRNNKVCVRRFLCIEREYRYDQCVLLEQPI